MTNLVDETKLKGGSFANRWFSNANLTRVRIVSGIILFVYVILHLLNHALGLFSEHLMRDMAWLMKKIIRFEPVTLILYGALAAHVLCSLWRVFERRTLKMPISDWFQLFLGLAIPAFLIVHVMGTRYAAEIYGINDTYNYVLLSVFVFAPSMAWANGFGLIAAWLHGCVGMHMWLRLKPWYSQRIRSALLVFATFWPTLSLAGYLTAGKNMIPRAQDGEFMEKYYAKLNLTSNEVWGMLAADINRVEQGFFTLIVLVVVARLVRRFLRGTNNKVTIDYVDGPKLTHPVGINLLEISKLGDVPHASVCGGRGRCSTCRVRILTSQPAINPPSASEVKVLSRVRAPEDVRLACQLLPKGDLQVIRLLPSDVTQASQSDHAPWSSGQEKTVTVMFADLRDFTKTSESRLPFDVVYLINQFSRAMGKVVESHNGRIDKFLGDGFMALFSVDESAEDGAVNAVNAAGAMIEELGKLNEQLKGDLTEPLRMGIGLHTGSVILGNMGYGSSRGLTAIGDTVNTASRLEAATKEQGCILCASAETLETAGLSGPNAARKSISIRGKSKKQSIYALSETKLLSKSKTPERA